jgi:hypothetical protein
MNLNRIGNFTADGKLKRAEMFLENNAGYLDELKKSKFPVKFRKTYERFAQDYERLGEEPKTEAWAERMMTWGNILTHRSKFL